MRDVFLRAGALVLAVSAAPGVGPASAQELPLFRLFLNDGTVVACLGEYARLESQVVCSLPIGGDAATHPVTLDASAVDWVQSDQYAATLRAALYAQSRGERDFAELSGEVARILNEVTQTADPATRLGLALEARRRLADWPRAHHDYRADDVRQILQLVDDAISDFRAAAGAQQFDLAFHAGAAAPPVAMLMAPPTPEQSVTAAVALADRLESAAERVSLFDAIARTLGGLGDRLPGGAAERLGALVNARLGEERRVDAAYLRMTTEVAAEARAAAARADVRGVERALGSVARRDARLGRQRPERVAAVLAAVQEDLDAARRLRLARDAWAARSTAYRSYQRSVRRPMAHLAGMARGLDDIKRLAGPALPALGALSSRATAALRGINVVVPPPDLSAVHALLVSAAQLASQAVAARQEAVAGGGMERAWQASSAAAGALMLLERARGDLEKALAPPAL